MILLKDIIEEKTVNINQNYFPWFNLPGESTDDIILDKEDIVTTGITSTTHFDFLENMINNSLHTIKLSSLLFDDERLADLLIGAAQRLKGGVYVLTSSLNYKLLDEYNYSKTDTNRHLDVIRKFEGTLVLVKIVPNLHAKFAIFDSQIGIVGSANLTVNSLHNVPELGVKIKGEQLKSIETLFDILWYQYSEKNS